MKWIVAMVFMTGGLAAIMLVSSFLAEYMHVTQNTRRALMLLALISTACFTGFIFLAVLMKAAGQ